MELQNNPKLQDEEGIALEFFKGRFDPLELLADLGIEVSHRDAKWIMCHCPDFMGNHKNGDANPSFGFHTEELRYNCFVCGGGSLFRLVEEMNGCGREDAERWLLAHSDLEPSDTSKFKEQIEAILTPHHETAVDPEYPIDALFPFRKIHPYLYERGLTKDVIIQYQIGFDEEHLGIVIPHFFQGKLKGWQTRHLVEKDGVYFCPVESCNFKNEKKIKVPKYKNTTAFPKQTTLYGYDQAMEYCREHPNVHHVILVESPFTVLYLASIGIKNVMATFGSFNFEQGSLVWPFTEVYFWPDNDSAGRENTKRAIAALWKYVGLYIVPPVEGEKSDAADLSLEEVKTQLELAVPSALYGTKAHPTR
jgi:DNA primase